MTAPHETIAAQIDTMQQGMATQAPAAVLGAFAAEQAGLEAAGLPDGITGAGSPMPNGKLLDVHAQPTTLDETRAGKPVVVVFYRGAWCPYCNIALRTYERDLLPELTRRGVELIAISPQTPDGSLSTQESKDLTYTVLSDPGNQIATQLGILTGPTADVRAAQGALGLDLTVANADGTVALPMPTVVILDAAGTIRWIDVHPNYATRTEPTAILDALDAAIG